MINIDILPDNQKALFEILKSKKWLENFYLAGGTALAFQLGHRQSIDFDFFSKNNFNNIDIIDKLNKIGDFELFSEDKNTLHGCLGNIMVSFIGYKYSILEPLLKINSFYISGIRDIACMKMSAIAGRGSKKDFIDIYFILKTMSISNILNDYSKKYGIKNQNNYQLLKSLAYFNDAESQPMPIMINNVSWSEIKNEIVDKIREFKLF